jgi:hypothetical protein
MPERYHIHTVPTPGRFYRVGKFGSIDWREDCSRCSNCVKKRCCFDVYAHESAHNSDPDAAVETLYECKACFSCVQGCTKGLLSLGVNPEFLEMGDEFWKPDLLLTTWAQADTGRIPVSGAGYRGPFHGPGFDSIWTDMSEIVRPTRDGIHGREYISTSVDVGYKPMRLSFAPDGRMLSKPANLLEVPIPVFVDAPSWKIPNPGLALARARAAKELKTVATVAAKDVSALPADIKPFVVPILESVDDWKDDMGKGVRMVQLVDGPDVLEIAKLVLSKKPEVIVAVRMPLQPNSADRVVELSAGGIRVFQVCADLHGCERTADSSRGRHIKDALREMHGRLVNEGMRDEITLIVSGGIGLAEHMAKAIICGADLVAVDTALLVSIGCRVCRGAHSQGEWIPGTCPAGLDSVDTGYATQRMVNLMGAWHDQLIEVLGAMGIREVRRLRGEMGRAIFMEEIEKEAFGNLAQVPWEQAGA